MVDDAAREKAFAAERGIAAIRVAIIVFNSLVYAFLVPRAGTHPALAFAVVGALVANESVTQYRQTMAARALAEELRESEERVRRLNDASFEGIVIHDQGVVLDCNEAFARLLGRPRADLVGRSAFELVA